ncbi:uncharacterized protein LY89DRAFT_178423 [Mollisia scopiformis]|uniref:Uncharacterized protein n=1 Tax=Mollisia scopiformis TaxID=149040 RepID=A0A194XT25_MOLSC|nr:uncharacterized protein LY89DRAFT_178423 [Mollisia scopiformis]KUJ23296.1 hypothetical protein LY89DRAFT_178423 [Mollisia scopiformis]
MQHLASTIANFIQVQNNLEEARSEVARMQNELELSNTYIVRLISDQAVAAHVVELYSAAEQIRREGDARVCDSLC